MRPHPIVLTLVLAVACDAPSAARGCVGYSDTVTVSGILVRETHPGPPNYEDVARGDQPETHFFIRPSEPLCARADATNSDEQDLDSVVSVQLLLDSAGYRRLRPLLDSTVSLRGTIFSRQTGHHHAPLVLTPLSMMRP